MEILFQLGLVVVLLLVGLVFGGIAEKRHFRELKNKEQALSQLLLFNEKRPPDGEKFHRATLVVGSVVIGEDYFKRIAAALKGLVGGRLTAYESLMDRGRREAIVRMKEAAHDQGASMIFNIHIDSARLSDSESDSNALFSAEFIAYGTALIPVAPA